MGFRTVLAGLLCVGGAQIAAAQGVPSGWMEVVVDGAARPQYHASGTWYIEALKGREYGIRLTNPLPVRVAVALAVDGLNTIDARHTPASTARKWVLDPYETVTISGWQVSQSQARRFEFTTEERSYGTMLGQTANLGIISAVFYRERVHTPVPISGAGSDSHEAAGRAQEPAPSAAPPAASDSAARRRTESQDEYAATGIGRRTDHSVRQVYLDLETSPVASVSLRYEFRPQLVRLGVLQAPPAPDTLTRRQRAKGFGEFCPDVKR